MTDDIAPSKGPGRAPHAIFRYGLAVLCVAAAVFLSLVLRPVLDAAVLLLAAVLIAAWFSGLWPALLASILATLALDYYFTPPLYSLTLELAHVRVAVFTLLAAFFASASAARRRAEHSLKKARDDMETRVRERTAELERSNQHLQEEIRERRRAEEAIESEFSESHDIAIDFSDAELPLSPPPPVALCLYRIVEEALANIARHSRARSARVRVTGGADGIHLVVEDAGAGFDPAILLKKAGLGFVSMQERLRVLHGTVRVDSAPSRGTSIAVWVPSTSLASADGEGEHGAASAAESAPTVSPA